MVRIRIGDGWAGPLGLEGFMLWNQGYIVMGQAIPVFSYSEPYTPLFYLEGPYLF